MKKKTNPKIFIFAFLDLLLAAGLAFLIYITFVADAGLKTLGYSYKDIETIKKYQIEEKVTEYNQSLVYAINSQEFKPENLDYYLSFNSQIDYTKIINDIAEKYSVEDLHTLQGYLNDDQIIELVDLDVIQNLDHFKSILDKGYEFENAIALSNSFEKAEDLQAFLSLPKLECPEKYLQYLKTGYDNETIIALYNHSETDFNLLSGISYFEELKGLLAVDGFKTENLARYIWHMHNWGSDYNRAVTRVNGNYDYTSPSEIEYSWFYKKSKTAADTSLITVLVNKTHNLDSNYIPSNLVEVTADYRGQNQQLVEEVAQAFIAMSDACYSATERRILAYSNYHSYAVEQSIYDEYAIAAEAGDSEVDSFAAKAGYSEHQTGLAIDISQKGSSFSELADCKSYDWLLENAYSYGFIQRYPKGEEWITGYKAVNYHFRYVGTEAAEIIHEYNWVLEEYAYLFDDCTITTW